MKKFNTHICCLYENSKHLLLNDSWLTVDPIHFGIHHLKVCSVKEQPNPMRKNISNLSQGYKTNNIEDIFKGTDSGITEGKVILMEGAPGIGKTILCKEIAYRWACKELLQDDRIVLLVFLSDPTTQKIKSVESLVHYMYRFRFDNEVINIFKACAAYLINTAGINVTIIVDGFHELSHLNKFMLDLLYKRILPLCRIVVSSHLAASEVLHQIADVKVQILGFTEEDRQMFLNNELKDSSDKLARLNSYLKENSIIDNLCYNPFILSILLCIAKEYEELPKTQTDLYSKFIIYTISRFLQRLTIIKREVSNLDELPLQFKEHFLEICKYAYNTLQYDKIIFTASELKTDFPAFADAPGSWSGLGLLKAAKYFTIEECISYNFLHLSIQEYLAAYYITTLNTNRQINILRNYFFVGKYLNMWIMYTGLSKNTLALIQFISGKSTMTFTFSRLFSIEKISEDIMQSKIKCLYLFQCLSKIKNTRLYNLVSVLFEKGILDLSNYTMLPKDINTLICILDISAPRQWHELNLAQCHIGDSGCLQLCKALVDRNEVSFNKINLSDNQLTTDSLEVIADFVVCCKTQVLYLSDDFDINSDAKLTHLAIKYTFKDDFQKYPLTIHIYHRENVVFNKLDKQTIVTHIKSRRRITGVYFINCKVDDEVVTALTDLITTYKLLTHVCLWNSSSSSSVIQNLLSVMQQREAKKHLFVYENSSDNFAFNLNTKYSNTRYPLFTFIYVNNFSCILHRVDDIHTTLTSLSYLMQLLETKKLTEIQISNSEMDGDVNLLLFLSTYRLRKLVLLNCQSSFILLQELIIDVNPLPSLSEIVIDHDDMTIADCCTMADELSSSQTHSVMIFHNNMLRGYRCHDEQLNGNYTEAVISTLLQLCDKRVDVIVYEKNLLDDGSFIRDAFKSAPIAYVLLSKSILSMENVNNSHVILTILISSSFYANQLSKIDFSNCDLTSAELIQLLLNVVNQCKFLAKFNSTNNGKSSYATKLLFNSLIGLSSLREIIIYEKNLTINDIYIVKDVLIKKDKNISVFLVTSNILLGYKCRNELFHYAVHLNVMITSVLLLYCTINQFTFESLRHASCVTKIIINHSKFSEQLPESILSSYNRLEVLNLDDNQLQLGAIKLATAIKNISSLKILELNDNNIPEEAADELSAAIRANNSLEILWLGSNHLASSTVIIVNALKQVTTLKVLNLNKNQNRSEELAPALTSIISNNKFVERLLLSDNNLNDDGVIKIAQSLCKHTKLKTIDLRSNNITEKSSEALASIISSNTGLEELYLGNNTIQLGVIEISTALKDISSLKVLGLDNNNIPEEAADELSAAIRANNSLEKLWLYDNRLGSSTAMIVNALKQVTTLKVLNLNENQNRSEELAPALTSIISNNKFVEILLLSDNNLNDDGVIKIAQSLCKHTKLKIINLQSNNITEKSAEALSSIISSNTGLQQLYLGNNTIQLGVITISTALKTISSLKVLDLDNNNIPEEAAYQLSAAIRANNSLEKLWLYGNRLGSSTAMIVNALKQVTTLKMLNLNDNQNRSEELAPALTSIISNNKFVERLLLSDNNLNDDGVIKIAQSLCKHTKLKIINLQSNNITEKSAEALSSIISSNTGLEELYLGNNTIQLGVITISTALKTISSLKVLDLDNNNIPEEAAYQLSAAIRANNSLEKLWLYGNRLGSSTAMIVNALKQVTTLKMLNLNDNQNRSEELAPALTSIISNNKFVERLLLSDNNLNDDGVIKIAQSLCKHTKLKTIDLRSNNITEKSSEALASIISSNTGLEELYLGNNTIQLGVIEISTALKDISSLKVLGLDNNNIPEEAADELSAAIRANNSLEKLWLYDNRLGSSTAMIVNALKQVTTLKVLNLNENQNRSEELAPALTSIISNNKFVEILLLSDNNLNDDGVIKIAQSLCKHTKLKIINLQSNNITEKSAEALSSIISSNTGLEELYLGNNTIQLGVITISTALKTISSLKVLDLDNNNIPEEAAYQLSAAIRANNSLEKLWLYGNRLGSSTAMIVNALKQVTTLKLLNLNDNQNRSEELAPALTSIISNNKFMESLLLSNNNLNDDGVIKIAQSLCKHTKLKIINLQSNNITEKSAEALASVISSNTGLEELYLGNNTIQLGVITLSTALTNISSLKVLDLAINNIPEEAADELSSAIRANNSLEKLWLYGNRLGSSTAMIVNALKQVTTLKMLNLNDNQNRSEELAPALTSIISNNKFMESLLLSNNNLNDDGVIKIAQSLCKHTKLKIINLQSNNITEKSAEALASIISSNTGLQELYLSNNTIQLGVITMSTALKNISSLKVLDLNNNNIPEEAADELSAAIRANNSLEKLYLNSNHLGSSSVMIVNALKQVTTLKELDLSVNQNRSKELAPALTSLILYNKSMEILSLSDNNLNDGGVIKIAQSLCKHTKLKIINLQSNNITEKSAEALSSIISSNTGLQQLYLGNNTIQLGVITMSTALKNISSLQVLDLDNNNIPEEAADELSAAIRANNSLKKLWFGGNHLGSSTVMIVNSLKQVTTLKELDLRENQNTSEELAPALTSLISYNKCMEKLSLSHNNLNDDGVIKIAQSLCKQTKLKMINLQSNNITEKSAEPLSSIISSNTGLQELYLDNNQLQLGINKISTALTTISSLKVLDLDNNSIPEEAADKLSAAIRANNSLEKLWLGGNHLGSSSVMIVNALKQVSTLRVLNLNNNQNTSEKLAPALTSLISYNKSTERLSLSDNNLNDDGVIKIAQSLCKHTKLKIINLRSNNITEKSAEALASIISSNTELQELYLDNNQLQLGINKISTALTTMSSLKVLDLDNNSIPEEAADKLSAAIRANNSLEKLWLGGNHLGSSSVMIVNALKQLSSLRVLNLNNNRNRSEELAPALTSLISYNKCMEKLSLSDNNLNDDGVIKIAQSLCKHTKLKIINLQSNNITEKSAEALSSIISSNTGLEELYLGNNTIQLGVITISTALKTISSLKVLDLDNNNIPEEAAYQLSAAIRANNLIENLYLNNNNLGPSMSVIAKTCCHISSLKKFAFKNTVMSKTATSYIAAVIRHNSSIQLLSISDNNLQSSGFMVITQALKVTSSLKFLYAYGINVNSTVSEDLSSVIEHNLSIEGLLLGDNLLENGLVQIAESCSRLTSLEFLELSHNCISPTQVVNLASTVSKCNSLEALSMGGVCLTVDQTLYLNVARIFEINKFVAGIKNTVKFNSVKQICNYQFYIFSELLRMIYCRTLPLNYQHLNVMYQHDFTYISYQHKKIFYKNKVDCELLSQEAKKTLSQIDSKAMISSLQIIRTLKAINLENNNIDEDAATELSGHLHCNNILEQLWLRGNELYDKGASVVLQSLHNLSTLLILDLSYNHLSSESADGIAVVVDNNCSLQQLWLDGNELLTRGVVRIASALKKLSSLRILSLCSNGITDDAAEEISNVITNNTLLVDLLLGNNQLQATGVCTIAVAIRKLFILRKLDLSNNHITPDVTEELAVTLSNCTGLQQLFLNDNMLGTKGTIKIANALKCINTLQVLTLSNNNITESAADVLVDVLRNNISLKIVLISGNDLQTTGVNLITQTAKNITTLQLLDVSDNNIRQDEKKNFKMLFDNYTIIV